MEAPIIDSNNIDTPPVTLPQLMVGNAHTENAAAEMQSRDVIDQISFVDQLSYSQREALEMLLKMCCSDVESRVQPWRDHKLSAISGEATITASTIPRPEIMRIAEESFHASRRRMHSRQQHSTSFRSINQLL
ncbi:Hypothetical protein, putative [Bodo saltans]|uniref:Uncharacterized protein n=1 Tax=Bodo saltans TaxID=75058 RepID=A0A0S4J7D8_BODSA|nr:Hypothetical protein, putative [Bodo saltans]|eukprot:CUG85794.1 Hypothetical protein, putative [Bodo saltans]